MNDNKEIYDGEFFDKYIELRKDESNYNDLLEQPIMFELVGDVKGKRVLDIGCGYGVTTKKIAENGADYVLGIDVSEKMIDMAVNVNAGKNIEYIVLPAEEISHNLGIFDLVVSCLTLHYIENLEKTFKDIYDLLIKGGEFVFSMEHPMLTASKTNQKWIKDEKTGVSIGVQMNNYCNEGERNIEWLGVNVTKYHHKIETIFNSLIAAGFVIEKIVEPSPTPKMVEKSPKIAREIHRPYFLMVKCRKN